MKASSASSFLRVIDVSWREEWNTTKLGLCFVAKAAFSMLARYTQCYYRRNKHFLSKTNNNTSGWIMDSVVWTRRSESSSLLLKTGCGFLGIPSSTYLSRKWWGRVRPRHFGRGWLFFELAAKKYNEDSKLLLENEWVSLYVNFKVRYSIISWFNCTSGILVGNKLVLLVISFYDE